MTLRIGSESVQINDVEVLGNGRFSGRIHGFESVMLSNIRGYKLEDVVDFEYLNIYALSLAYPI